MFEKTKARIQDKMAESADVIASSGNQISAALYIVAGFLAMILLALVTRAR